MPNIKMRDTTAHSDYGSLRKGEVYAVSDEFAAHLVKAGLATTTTAQTSAERQAELDESDAAAEDQTPVEEESTTEQVVEPIKARRGAR